MIVLQIILLVLTSYLNLSSTISTNLSISESQDDSFQNGIITTDIGKLVLYNSHYIFPLQLFYTDVIGHYRSLHNQFFELYTLIEDQERKNITNDVISLLTEELQ